MKKFKLNSFGFALYAYMRLAMGEKVTGRPSGRDRSASHAAAEGIVLIIKAVVAVARSIPRACTFARRQISMIGLHLSEIPCVPIIMYAIYPQGKRKKQGIKRARRINARRRELGISLGPGPHAHTAGNDQSEDVPSKDLRCDASIQQPDPAMMYGGQRRRVSMYSFSIPESEASALDEGVFSETNGAKQRAIIQVISDDHRICAKTPEMNIDKLDSSLLQNVTTTRGKGNSSRRQIRAEQY